MLIHTSESKLQKIVLMMVLILCGIYKAVFQVAQLNDGSVMKFVGSYIMIYIVLHQYSPLLHKGGIDFPKTGQVGLGGRGGVRFFAQNGE